MPGRDDGRDPRDDPRLRERPPRTGARLPRRDRRRCARTCTARSRLRTAMPIEFAERIRRIPVYPAADGYALAGDVALLASNESPYPPIPAVVDAVTRVAGRAQPLPRPDQLRAARGAERPLRRARAPDRDRQRLLRHPAGRRRGAARAGAPSSSTPGPASASTRTWPRPPGARAIEVPVDAEHRHDLDAMLAEITAATRLVIVCNPNNPTSTALPLEAIAGVRARGAAPRRGRARRGLLRVQPAAGSRRVDRAARPPPEPRPAAHVLEGLRALRAARRLRALRLGGVPRRGRPGAPAVLLQRRRPGRRDRGAARTRTRSRAASSATSPSGSSSRTACAGSGSSPPSRRRTSSGSTCRRATPRPRSCARSAPRGVLVRAGGVARPRGRAAGHGRHRDREREARSPRSAPRCWRAAELWYKWLAVRTMADRAPHPRSTLSATSGRPYAYQLLLPHLAI